MKDQNVCTYNQIKSLKNLLKRLRKGESHIQKSTQKGRVLTKQVTPQVQWLQANTEGQSSPVLSFPNLKKKLMTLIKKRKTERTQVQKKQWSSEHKGLCGYCTQYQFMKVRSLHIPLLVPENANLKKKKKKSKNQFNRQKPLLGERIYLGSKNYNSGYIDIGENPNSVPNYRGEKDFYGGQNTKIK